MRATTKQFAALGLKYTKGQAITLNGPTGTFTGKCGATFNYLGHRFAVTKAPDQCNWTVSEVTTGLRAYGGGTTILRAIDSFINIAAQKGITTKEFSDAIKQHRKVNA